MKWAVGITGALMILSGVAFYYALKEEREKCELLGGQILRKDTSSVGVGISSSGSAVVVPQFSSVSFCLSADGRILF
jgi:hypothetical protein